MHKLQRLFWFLREFWMPALPTLNLGRVVRYKTISIKYEREHAITLNNVFRDYLNIWMVL